MMHEQRGPAAEKEARLAAWLETIGSIAIGYSGGVDSAYLAALSVATLGPDHVLGIIGRSASFPKSQWENATEVARAIGLRIIEVESGELDDPRYVANPSNRCYFCKSDLWSRLAPVAREHGMAVLADGTNADDLLGHRPGAQAAREQRVVSPLAMFEFSKDEIRERSRARGLSTWEQPSSPCLSSRIPYGTAVTINRLRQVEQAESGLRALGVVGDLRVRHFGDIARVELSQSELQRFALAPLREQLEAVVRAAGYEKVEMDPRGFRSGALNESKPDRNATVSRD